MAKSKVKAIVVGIEIDAGHRILARKMSLGTDDLRQPGAVDAFAARVADSIRSLVKEVG